MREGYVDMLAGDEDVQRKLGEVGVPVGVDSFFFFLVTQWSSEPTEINSTAMRHVVKR